MQKSFFFDAELVDDEWDRAYLSSDFASYFATFIGNGVFPNPATNLQIVAIDNDMNIRIKPGKAFLNGRMYENTEEIIITLDPANGIYNRIDRIVIRCDYLQRIITAKVKKGEIANTPNPKEITRNSDYFEIALADVKINKGIIKVTQADILDLRLNSELCGIVHGTVDQVDTTAIFNQYLQWYNNKTAEFENIMEEKLADYENWTQEQKQAFITWRNNQQLLFEEWTEIKHQEFEEWLQSLRDLMDENVALKLQNQIDDLKQKVGANLQQELTEIKKRTIIVSETEPNESCIWYKIIENNLEEIMLQTIEYNEEEKHHIEIDNKLETLQNVVETEAEATNQNTVIQEL